MHFTALQDILESFYGAKIDALPKESDFTIGTTAVPLDSLVRRDCIWRALSNTGSTTIAISLQNSLTITTGIPIAPNGFLLMEWRVDQDLVNRPWFAISSAAGGTLHMIERFIAGA
ncbi:MAG TPA: hypothetical protein VND65_22285 [Candidatus Binatia bacterium]|nr:hypothetical protein [Candidatus Binatia bacterium]